MDETLAGEGMRAGSARRSNDAAPAWLVALTAGPPVRPVRLSAAEAQARSAIAQKLAGLDVTLADRPWHLRVTPFELGVPADQADRQDRWQVRLQWAGADFTLTMPAAAALAWIAGTLGDAAPELADALPELPDEYAAAVFEGACTQVLQALSHLRRGVARVVGIERGAERLETAQSQAPPHAFDVELECPGEGGPRAVLRAQVATDRLGLLLIAGLLARLPVLPNGLALEGLPIRLQAVLGCSWIPAADLASLQPGDAVLMQRCHLDDESQLWLAAGRGGLRVRCDDSTWRVTQPWQFEGPRMAIHDEQPPTPPGQANLSDLPLCVCFDLGERTLTLGELQALHVGQALLLDQPLSQVVNLRVNGARVGCGELIEVDGRLGVAITALHDVPAQFHAHADGTAPTDDDDS